MKRYTFRLETVLRVRRLEEEAARLRVLEANRALGRARSVRDDAGARYRHLPADLGACSADEFRRSRQRSELAAATLAARQAQVDGAVGETELTRSLWMGAVGRVRVLERLDARRREEHRMEGEREETRFLDDIGGRLGPDSGRETMTDVAEDAGAR